ncbi:YadA-like family protein [Veillonella sp. CHU732]|uniref:YadA-like family protein n=1 Tax=Veillonella sp. CHU732 TaxID=2490949 RepID=UPI000F8CAB7D|nr:YadA-like family protein [Veillonella sp. CHU732]
MKRHCVVPLLMASILAIGLGSVQAAGNDSYEAGGGNASGDNSVAIGASASSIERDSVSIGAGASSANYYGVAIGREARSDKAGAISMGYKAQAMGNNTLALGREAQARGENGSISIGLEAITGDGSSGSVAIGTSAKTEAADSVALGSYTLGNRNKGALGYDPSEEFVVKGAIGTLQISTAKQGTTSNTAASTWQSTRGAVSIGNSETGDTRQLIGLAAGSEDTDGVNVAQLKSLETATYKTIDAAAKGLRGEIHQGNAMTAALAALKPIQYKVDEPTQVMVGIGKQEEKIGYALGVAHYTNERTMFNAGAAFSEGQMIYNLGATLRFGKGGKAAGAFGDNASLSVLSDALQEEKQQNDRQEQAIINLQSDNRQLRNDIEMLKQLVSTKK